MALDLVSIDASLRAALGSDNVYFQPPSNLTMKYPCITYSINKLDTQHADNAPYTLATKLTVTVIYSDPLSDIPYKVAMLKGVRHDRNFQTSGLYHSVFEMKIL